MMPVAADDVSPAYAPDRIFVKYSDPNQVSAMAVDEERIKYVEGILSTYTLVPGLQVVQLRDNVTVEEAIDYFQKQPGVEYAEPDYYVSASMVPNDTYYDRLWGMKNTGQEILSYDEYLYDGIPGDDVSAEWAWNLSTGDDVVVAVVDTGVNYNHEDLSANMWSGTSNHGYDFVNNDDDPMDDMGHGTHCAGTIAAVGNNNKGVIGMAPNAKIMAVKVLNETGYGSISNITDGIQYAVNNDADIISLSLGSERDPTNTERYVFTAARNAGVLCVIAAGNNGYDIDYVTFSPAVLSSEFDNIITVSASTGTDGKASFSNYGSRNSTIAAPGECIYSTNYSGSNNVYSTMYGTSMATPLVAGVAALMLSVDSTLTPSEIREVMIDTADHVDEWNDKVAADGRVNAYKAVREVLPPSTVYFSGGSGIPADPYQINSASDLKNLSLLTNAQTPDPTNGGALYSTLNYIVTAPIDLSAYQSGEGWVPIGDDSGKFKGNFDGNGKKITNLNISRPDTDYQGLFGYIDEASVKNVVLEILNVTGNYRVGGLIGWAKDNCTIEKCAAYISGTVTSSPEYAQPGNVGGLIGKISNGCYVDECYVSGNVGNEDISTVGGLIGDTESTNAGYVTNCSAFCSVIGYEYVGGLIGKCDSHVINCIAIGDVSGHIDVGGIVGKRFGINLDNCVALNSIVSGNTDSTHRIVGSYNNQGTETNIYGWSGTVDKNGNTFASDIRLNGTSVTSAEVWNNQSSYESLGADFTNIWKMNNNPDYLLPVLKWQTLPVSGDASYLNGAPSVIFNSNGATSGTMPKQKIPAGDRENLRLNTFTKEHCTFGGWNKTSSDGTGIDYEDGAEFTMPDSDVTLYAVWKVNVTKITLDALGGTGSTASVNATYGDNDLDSEVHNPNKAGHTFKGWNSSEVGGVTIINTTGRLVEDVDGYTDENGNWVKDIACLTLYAAWETNVTEITLTSNGASPETQKIKVSYNTSALEAITTPQKTSHKFLGWNTTSNGGIKVIGTDGKLINSVSGYTNAEGKWINESSSAEFFAAWVKQITVTFNANGGTGEMSQQTFENNTPQELAQNTFTKTDYSFKGWNKTSSDGTGIDYTDKQSISITDSMTLYAVWSNDYVYVKFNSTGSTGGSMPDQKIVKDAPTNLNENKYTKTGYSFKGWNSTSTGTNVEFVDKASVTLSENKELWALWTPKVTDITLDAVGGTGSTAAVNITYNTSAFNITIVNPQKAGYTFVNWTDNEGTAVITPTGSLINGTSYANADGKWIKDVDALTLKAKWEANKTIILLDANGGTVGTEAVEATYGSSGLNITPAVPSRNMYYFTGWNTTADGGIQVIDKDGQLIKSVSGYTNESSEWIKDSSSETLYAQWTEMFNITVTVDDISKGAVLTKSERKSDVSANQYNVTLLKGDSATFSITPKTGYTTQSVIIDGVTISNCTGYTFENVAAGHTITAGFGAAPTEEPVDPVVVNPTTNGTGITGSLILFNSTDVSGGESIKINVTSQPAEDFGTIPADKTVKLVLKIESDIQPQSTQAIVVINVTKNLISDPTKVVIYHNCLGDSGWQQVQVTNLTYIDEGTYYSFSFLTGSFSYFTITEAAEPVQPSQPITRSGGGQDTGSGNYKEYDRSVTDGGTVSFGSSPVVTSVDLPKGVSGSVVLVAESNTPAPSGKNTVKVFDINVQNYPSGEAATITFKLTEAEIEKAGYTPADICLYHCDDNGVWTKLATTYVIKNGIVYYEAVTTDFSPFAIVYEEGAAKADETIVVPVETATAEPKPVVATVTPVKTTATAAPQATASPMGLISLVIGLGAAAVVLRRK